MSAYDQALYRIAQYRIILDRDADRGIIPPAARGEVDAGFVSLAAYVESARVTVEGAGSVEDGFVRHFAAACGDLGRQLFVSMYRESDPRRLAARAAELRAEGRRLVEHLWMRVDRAA